MQYPVWMCPYHQGNNIEYVSIKPDSDSQQILYCRTCVSEKFGGVLENFKQLQDVLEELKQKGDQYKDVLEFKEKFVQEFYRMIGKFNGIFESRPYLSIQIGQNSTQSDLKQVISNHSHNKSKDKEFLKKEINSWYNDCEKSVQNLGNDIKVLNKQIELEFKKNNDYLQLEDEMVGELKYPLNPVPILIEPNWEDNYFFFVQNSDINMISLKNDKIKQEKIIVGDVKITSVTEDKGHSKILVGYQDGSFQVWEQNFDRKYRSFFQQKDHRSSIMSIILCKKDNLLITQSKESIHFWQYDGKGLRKKNVFPYENEQISIAYLCVNLNYSLLAAVINGQTITIIKLDQLENQVQPFDKQMETEIIEICFMKNNDFVVFPKGCREFYIYKLNDEGQIESQYHQKIQLKYLYTTFSVKIKPKFYKEVGILQIQTDQEIVFVKQDENYQKIEKQPKQNDQQKTIIEKIQKKQILRFFNFGQHSLYLSTEFHNILLKVAKIKYPN